MHSALMGYVNDERARWEETPSAHSVRRSEVFLAQRSEKLREVKRPQIFSATASGRSNDKVIARITCHTVKGG